MKFVPFVPNLDIPDTQHFLKTMVESSPAGQTIGEMRERLAVFSKIKTAPSEGVTLEDAEHATLLRILNTRNDFALTREGIIAVVDAVAGAKAPADKPAKKAT